MFKSKKIIPLFLILIVTIQCANAAETTVLTGVGTPTSPPPLSTPPISNEKTTVVNTMTTNATSVMPTTLPPPPLASPQQMNKTDTSERIGMPNVSQYQTWLKNNGQVPTTPPPAINQTIPNPPPSQTPVRRIILSQGSSPPSPPIVISPPMSYSKSQELMLRSAPDTGPPSAESTDAFNMMMEQNTPLTPQQVVKLRQLIDQSQRAAAIPATIPPKPVSSTLMINLAPGVTPPAIRLALGYITSLVFVDSTGTPWPIASYDIGDPKTANIQWDGKSNILLIQAISPYGDSDLVIRMVGLPTPVTLELVSGQRVVDYRTDIHVPGIGPNTKDLPIGTGLPESANELLLSVLDGVAPPGSRQLTVKGGSYDCQVWLLGDTMFLRTRLTLLSPGWVGRMVSPDGMHAYQLQKTSTLLVSQYGQPVELKIEGF